MRYDMIKHLNHDAMIKLLKVYNEIWLSLTFPIRITSYHSHNESQGEISEPPSPAQLRKAAYAMPWTELLTVGWSIS